MITDNSIIKVIIAEDHLLFADGVEQILSAMPNIHVIAKVGNGKLLMQALNNLKPDLLLLDINMPYMDGLEAAALVKKNIPSVKIIFLSMYYDKKIVAFARQHSINGFVMKTVMAPDLKDAVLRVISGGEVFILPQQMQQQTGVSPDSFSKKFRLSQRELEIIEIIKEGKSTKQISDALFLSFYTVETHRKNIMKKLGVKNVAELIAFVDAQDKTF